MNPNQSFNITGLAGEKKLQGEVSIHGAKNSALKAIAGSVLFDGPVTLENIPDTSDIHTICEILKKLGAKVEWQDVKKTNDDSRLAIHESCTKKLLIDSSTINSTNIDSKLAANMRASVVLTGPLLARFKKVSFPAPGGCVIGARPIDLFLSGYGKMGAKIDEDKFVYTITTQKGLQGAKIFFNRITVGGTETLMMAAVLGHGTTILENCALEPEIVNVAEWLNACGANIKGIGTSTLTIKGTGGKLLSHKKKNFVTIPDRIEAGSYLLLGALCAKDLTIRNCRPDHMEVVINILKDSGVPITFDESNIFIKNNIAPLSLLTPISDLHTHEYPGFPTDLQAPMVVFLTQVNGESRVTETIFEGRFKYVDDLQAMGADITVMNGQEILIHGPRPLVEPADDTELRAHDIRAGFAVVMAALVGKGKFTVNNVHLIDRGYEKLEVVLRALGVEMERV